MNNFYVNLLSSKFVENPEKTLKNYVNLCDRVKDTQQKGKIYESGKI